MNFETYAISWFNSSLSFAGVSTAYMLSGNIALTGSYQHYFGVSNENVFTTDKAVPDFDVVSFGVRYYF